MNPKIKLAILIIVLLGAVFALFRLQPSTPGKSKPTPLVSSNPNPKNNEQPRIVSTIPDPLDQTIIPASQVIEISFNKPLQNVPEFKVRIEPKVDFKVELSSERKTAKITFIKPLDLGAAYTLTINPDTKFDEVGDWGQTKDFHFRTVRYRGI